MKKVINFNNEGLVKAKFVSQLVVGDYVNTRPKGKPRVEQIIKIEPNKDDKRLVDLTTESGVYQAALLGLVIP